jgi:ABC-2 type transport system permease protein
MTGASTKVNTSAASSVARPKMSRPLWPDVVRSEWTKLWTVRSTYFTLLVAATSMIGLGALFTARYRVDKLGPVDRATFNPTALSLSGFFLAQLAFAVLGVLAITGEHSTGSIRATFAAVPQRRMVLAGKAVVLAVVSTVVGTGSAFAAFFLGQAILQSKGLEAHIGDPGVLRSVIGAGIYLAVVCLLALGVGALIRHTAGAIALVVVSVFILPGLVAALPSTWQDAITKYLPSYAGQAIIGHTRFASKSIQLLSPWAGVAVFCGYAAATLIASMVAVSLRDA